MLTVRVRLPSASFLISRGRYRGEAAFMFALRPPVAPLLHCTARLVQVVVVSDHKVWPPRVHMQAH